jgi:hypothetical protein
MEDGGGSAFSQYKYASANRMLDPGWRLICYLYIPLICIPTIPCPTDMGGPSNPAQVQRGTMETIHHPSVKGKRVIKVSEKVK